jgi:3-hexulose-6-phosphate synthase
MPLLQVALDLIDLEKAITIALDVADYVDYIEVGTPLIKKCGLKAVERLSKEVEKPIVADMKTMDTGYLEASIAYEAGAYFTTVLGVSGKYTIKEALRAREDYDKGLMIDTIGISDIRRFLESILTEKLIPDYILLHSGIDMQHMGIMPFQWLKEVKEYEDKLSFGVAGGINFDNVHMLKGFKFIKLVIVGGGITNKDDPRRAAKELKNVLSSL